MRKVRLFLPEEFTVHATAIIRHVHMLVRERPRETLESRIELLEKDVSSYSLPMAEWPDTNEGRTGVLK